MALNREASNRGMMPVVGYHTIPRKKSGDAPDQTSSAMGDDSGLIEPPTTELHARASCTKVEACGAAHRSVLRTRYGKNSRCWFGRSLGMAHAQSGVRQGGLVITGSCHRCDVRLLALPVDRRGRSSSLVYEKRGSDAWTRRRFQDRVSSARWGPTRADHPSWPSPALRYLRGGGMACRRCGYPSRGNGDLQWATCSGQLAQGCSGHPTRATLSHS